MREDGRLRGPGIAVIVLALAWAAAGLAADTPAVSAGGRAKAAAAADGAEVIVKFESTPAEAWVEIGGEPACVTPCSRALPPGAVVVTMKKPECKTRRESVAVKAGMPAVAWTLAPRLGEINVRATDAQGNAVEGDVYVDGAKAGKTYAVLPARIGTREVEVRSAVGSWKGVAEVRERRTASVAARVGAAAAVPRPEPKGDARVEIEVGDSYAKGPADAPVTIVVFSDYQCPFCARAEATMKQIETDYGSKVRFVFKNLILPFHPKAPLAANAALAAGEQGKFWEMHDRIFAEQAEMDRDKYIEWAKEFGLDVDRFAKAMDDPNRYKDFLAVEAKQADALGIRGTPTFLINGRKVVGAQPLENFTKVIDEELKGGD